MASQIQNSVVIAGYDVDRAMRLLGPADYTGPYETQGCCEFICDILSRIWITIKRIFNLLFGDCKWYDNDVAEHIIRHVVLHNCTTIDGRIQQLYHELESRAYDPCCCSNGSESYADRLRTLIQQQLGANQVAPPEGQDDVDEQTHPSISPFTRPPTTPSLPLIDDHSTTENIFSDVQEYTPQTCTYFRRGETGNITVLNYFDRTTRLGNAHDEDISSVLPGIDASLREYTHSLDEGEQYHATLRDILAPRKYQYPESTAASMDTGEVDDSHDPRGKLECTKDPKYATAKDPYQLFTIALEEACKELQITGKDLATPRFNETEEGQKAYRLAVYKVLAQADICTNDCHGVYVKFNNYLQARYQQPMLIYAPDKKEGGFDPHILYTRDILSSTKVGCDPEGARRLIKVMEDSGSVDAFKNYLLADNEQDNPDMKVLKELIDTMAGQVRNRYGSKIVHMAARALEQKPAPQPPALNGTNFRNYTKNAETPIQLISRSIVWSADQYASLSLISEDDMYGGDAYPHVRNLVCLTTAFEIINQATALDDFRLALTNQIHLECGKFYSYEPMPESPDKLTARERFVPNEFSGVGTEYDLSTDPIKVKHLMDQLTSNEMVFFKKYLYSNPLSALYRMKGSTNDTDLNSEAIARAELEELPPDRRRIIQDLFAEILSLKNYITEKYFNDFSPTIMETVEFKEGAPQTVSFTPPRPTSDLITQDIQWEFLGGITQEEVTIKDRPQRTVGTSTKIRWRDYPYGKSAALTAQNDLVNNPARCGNCMYGALALEIFGDRARNNIEHYAGVLRAAAADYMLAHPDQYLQTMSKSSDVYNRQESEAQFMSRMRPTLEARLRDHCAQVRDNSNLMWGTALEMEAIAAVFGVPIHVFYVDHPMQLGTEGIEDGVIQPNGYAGANYTGAPIRLYYSGVHYMPIRLKTASAY